MSTSAPAVHVSGYFRHTAGQGQAARLYVQALLAAGLEVSTETIDPFALIRPGPVPDDPYGTLEWNDLPASRPAEVNLLCVNGRELGLLAAERGTEFLRERPSIAVWTWEADRVPDDLLEPAALLDEIWVYSSYVAGILQPLLDVPVAVVPPPVTAPGPAAGKPPLEVPARPLYLHVFDFHSLIERKNPLGLIDAFRRAFEPGEGPALMLKTVHAGHLPEHAERLRAAVAGHPDVHWVDRLFDPVGMAALFAAADCYVSLHRSEGFGLTLAEAMSVGTPAVATGYSGNIDFMREDNSYLVPYRLEAVDELTGLFPKGARWAEPDLDRAAAALRRVAGDPEEARCRGERGRETVRGELAPAAVGATARARIEALLG